MFQGDGCSGGGGGDGCSRGIGVLGDGCLGGWEFHNSFHNTKVTSVFR